MPQNRRNRIKQSEYEHLQKIKVPYEGFVESENGELIYVLCEVTVVGYYENKNHVTYGTSTKSQEIYVCKQDNTRVDTRNLQLNAEKKAQESYIRGKAKEQLLQALISYFQNNEYARRERSNSNTSSSDPSQIKVDVPENNRRAYYQTQFAEFKIKIENQTIKRSDFSSSIIFRLQREIDIYFACFDPDDSNYEEFWGIDNRVGFWESLIPIWGSAKEATYHFKHENYWRGIGFTVLAISDVFLIKSIATGVAKGAWKTGSHTWKATRPWLGKHGYAKRGEHMHHWLITQKTAKKYGIESISNQPWNLKTFPDISKHYRFGHGVKYRKEIPGTYLQQIWYGTPTWPKSLVGSYSGRTAIDLMEEEEDY